MNELVGRAACAVGLFITGCGSADVPQNIQPQRNVIEYSGTDRGYRFGYRIVRLNPDILMVSRTPGSPNIDIAVENGIRYIKEKGCVIVAVEKAHSGDIVKVSNGTNCLPELE